MRGEREDGRKGGKMGEGCIFSEDGRGGEGRYAQTVEIYGQTSRLRTSSTGDDPPDGDRTEQVGMGAGAGVGTGCGLAGVVSVNPSRRRFRTLRG